MDETKKLNSQIDEIGNGEVFIEADATAKALCGRTLYKGVKVTAVRRTLGDPFAHGKT